jgi:hypothetical protein
MAEFRSGLAAQLPCKLSDPLRACLILKGAEGSNAPIVQPDQTVADKPWCCLAECLGSFFLQRPCDILGSCERLVDPRDSVRIALKLITPAGKCIDYLAPECLIQLVIADRLRTMRAAERKSLTEAAG